MSRSRNRTETSRRSFLRWSSGIVLASSTSALAGEFVPHWHKTRTQPTTGIPNRDTYQYMARSDTRVVPSMTAMLLRKRTIEVLVDEFLADQDPILRDTERGSETENLVRNADGSTTIERRLSQSREENDGRLRRTENSSRSLSETHDQPRLQDSDRLDAGATNRFGLSFGRTQMHREPLRRNDSQSSMRESFELPPPPRNVLADTKRIVLYQLELPTLAIEYCSISGVLLQLHSDGQWVLSLRADHHPQTDPGGTLANGTLANGTLANGTLANGTLPYRPMLHIKRNEFVVRLRCLGSFVNEPEPIYRTAGKPVLADLPEARFWVQNGQPLFLRRNGRSALVAEMLPLIDRVEVEFFFVRESGFDFRPK